MRKVLIVDDSEEIGRIYPRVVKRIFKTAGLDVDVVVVASGQAALKALHDHQFTDIICDIEFPGSAVAIYDMIAEVSPAMNFIANTGNINHKDAYSLRIRGVPVLEKPVSSEDFARLLLGK